MKFAILLILALICLQCFNTKSLKRKDGKIQKDKDGKDVLSCCHNAKSNSFIFFPAYTTDDKYDDCPRGFEPVVSSKCNGKPTGSRDTYGKKPRTF